MSTSITLLICENPFWEVPLISWMHPAQVRIAVLFVVRGWSQLPSTRRFKKTIIRIPDEGPGALILRIKCLELFRHWPWHLFRDKQYLFRSNHQIHFHEVSPYKMGWTLGPILSDTLTWILKWWFMWIVSPKFHPRCRPDQLLHPNQSQRGRSQLKSTNRPLKKTVSVYFSTYQQILYIYMHMMVYTYVQIF